MRQEFWRVYSHGEPLTGMTGKEQAGATEQYAGTGRQAVFCPTGPFTAAPGTAHHHVLSYATAGSRTGPGEMSAST
jgi:hypothetical protein